MMSPNEIERAGCKACNMTGWILREKKNGRLIARPCTCLYEIAKKSMESDEKSRAKETMSQKIAEEIIKAYERHKEKKEEK